MTDETPKVAMLKAGCPICAKPVEVEYRPFCSKRCADVDLQRWLTDGYAIPVIGDEGDMDDEG
jgi:endogenous inhibitor of DNA gyrase (YacG/DUF329 family)